MLRYFRNKYLCATRYWLFCGVFTRKEHGANGNIAGRENSRLNLKLRWVINHQNWAILRKDKDWMFDWKEIFLLLCNHSVPSKVSCDRERGMKRQDSNNWRKISRLNLASWNGISRSLCKILKNYIGIKFYFGSYVIHSSFHVSPRTKPSRSSFK